MLEQRPWQRLVPDQSLILSPNPEGAEYNVASVSADGDFLLAYLPYGKKIKLATDKIKGGMLRVWWFNPRDGRTLPLDEQKNEGILELQPHSEGRGSDWVLVIDDAGKNYKDPAVR
jgi:hypothetical protein